MTVLMDGIVFGKSPRWHDGRVWYADVAHHHCVRVREGGEVHGTVELDRGAFSCTLSRDDQPQLRRRPGVRRPADGGANRAGRYVRGPRTGRRQALAEPTSGPGPSRRRPGLADCLSAAAVCSRAEPGRTGLVAAEKITGQPGQTQRRRAHRTGQDTA